MDTVIITNRFGHEYEVTRERAEKMIKNGDIPYTSVQEVAPVAKAEHVEIVKEIVEMSEPEVPSEAEASENVTMESTNEPSASQKSGMTEGITEIQALRAEYKEKFSKKVPVAKINDVEWINKQLSN